MIESPAQSTPPQVAGRLRPGLYLFLVLICLVFFVPGIFTLPPVDRDEARFAQATTQMLETGDFVRIYFQDEARNKKPIAIYWLQAASAALLGSAQHRNIWPYRIPSLLGAILAVLLTFSLGKRLFGERTGLFGAVLTASSLLLIMEAHLATTDAVLLATVLAAQVSLSRFYVRDKAPPGNGAFLTFWVAQAIGILVKGPVTPLISLLTIGCLSAADRDLGWLRGIRPVRGLAMLVVLASPWAIAIGLATKGAFFQQSLGGDFLTKVASGMESHGFPPGYYVLLMPLALWPASALAGASVFRAWKTRSAPSVRFCLAWAAPAWILFELVPTKLPHYVLPLYPPLCLLVAHAIVSSEEGRTEELGSRLIKTGYTACQLVIILLGLAALVIPWIAGNHFKPAGLIPAVTGIAAAALSTWKFFRRRYIQATVVSIAATALVLAPLLQWVIPGADWLWLSNNVASAVKQTAGDNVLLCSSGYYEPSLVFLLGTRTRLTNPGGAALFLKNNPEALALVAAGEDEAFKREATDKGLHVRQTGAFRGFNYSKGQKMLLRLYGNRQDAGTEETDRTISDCGDRKIQIHD
jgi:4-amino-4-deoxy-L-arabinose transferase-like glycosyltransferase